MFMLIYIGIAKPYVDPLIHFIDIFNELCIVCSAYLLLIFTDYVDDDEIQYISGWVLIGIAVTNMLLNFSIIL